MFTQAWFWVSFAAFFFASYFRYNDIKGRFNKASFAVHDLMSVISALGLIIFWIIGLFVADHWWHPLIAFTISLFGSGMVISLIEKILPRSFALVLAAMSPFLSFGLGVAAYLTWY